MRINPAYVNQALSRAKTLGVTPVAKVTSKPATGIANAIEDDFMDVSDSSSYVQEPVNKRKKRRGWKNLNLDGLGEEVDIWV